MKVLFPLFFSPRFRKIKGHMLFSLSHSSSLPVRQIRRKYGSISFFLGLSTCFVPVNADSLGNCLKLSIAFEWGLIFVRGKYFCLTHSFLLGKLCRACLSCFIQDSCQMWISYCLFCFYFGKLTVTSFLELIICLLTFIPLWEIVCILSALYAARQILRV